MKPCFERSQENKIECCLIHLKCKGISSHNTHLQQLFIQISQKIKNMTFTWSTYIPIFLTLSFPLSVTVPVSLSAALTIIMFSRARPVSSRPSMTAVSVPRSGPLCKYTMIYLVRLMKENIVSFNGLSMYITAGTCFCKPLLKQS